MVWTDIGELVKAQRDQLIEFKQEVEVLKRISHHHTVSLIASFTDLSSFSLILNPVAKDVLKSMLERQSHDEPLPGMRPFVNESFLHLLLIDCGI